MWPKSCFAIVETYVSTYLLLLSFCPDSDPVCEVGDGGDSCLPFLPRVGSLAQLVLKHVVITTCTLLPATLFLILRELLQSFPGTL